MAFGENSQRYPLTLFSEPFFFYFLPFLYRCGIYTAGTFSCSIFVFYWLVNSKRMPMLHFDPAGFAKT